MDTPDHRRFAEFRLNLVTGELTSAQAPVRMERQPARALAYLVRHAGRLVTREELRRAVWDEDTHVDFDRGLNYCLRQIRIALGDDVRAPRFIETVPRQGYRFIEPVSIRSSAVEAAPRRRVVAAAAIVTAALAVLAVVESGPRNESHHAAAVAVLRTVHGILF
jgi:DNA-binding winged helix-turn-helix (wHTH) protein